MSLLVSTFHFRPLIPPAKSVSWSIFVQRRRIPPPSPLPFNRALSCRPRHQRPLPSRIRHDVSKSDNLRPASADPPHLPRHSTAFFLALPHHSTTFSLAALVTNNLSPQEFVTTSQDQTIFVQCRRIPHLPHHSTALFLAALITNDLFPQEFVTASRSQTILAQHQQIPHPPLHSSVSFLAALVTNIPSPQKFVAKSRSRSIFVRCW